MWVCGLVVGGSEGVIVSDWVSGERWVAAVRVEALGVRRGRQIGFVASARRAGPASSTAHAEAPSFKLGKVAARRTGCMSSVRHHYAGVRMRAGASPPRRPFSPRRPRSRPPVTHAARAGSTPWRSHARGDAWRTRGLSRRLVMIECSRARLNRQHSLRDLLCSSLEFGRFTGLTFLRAAIPPRRRPQWRVPSLRVEN